MGVASALIGQFGFLTESALKMRCTKFFCQTKVVTNQTPQLLCYVTFFNILHHYGVIAASQIRSLCRESIVTSYGTDFYFLDYTKYRESIASQKIDFQILMNSCFEGHWSPKKLFLACCLCVCLCVCVCLSVCLSVCLCVCVSVCGHHNSKNN